MPEYIGKYGDTQNDTDDDQNQDNGHNDQLRLGPVAEGIFLFGVAAPDKEHNQVHDAAHQRNAGNQRIMLKAVFLSTVLIG